MGFLKTSKMVLIIIGVLFSIAAGAFRGARDENEFHHDAFMKRWNIKESRFWGRAADTWRNKYKEGSTTEPAFFLSTTLLVWLTDSWHLFNMLSRVTLFGAFASMFAAYATGYIPGLPFELFGLSNTVLVLIECIILVVLMWLLEGLGFSIIYRTPKKKRASDKANMP